jgi:L-alanine-DL-glutamate epimerase-like enolase superfamily enzyme
MTNASSLDQTQDGEALEDLYQRVAKAAGSATIASITTVRSAVQPNVLHVMVEDSEGVTGLGETFYGASVAEAHLHDVVIPALSADTPIAEPRAVARSVSGYVGYSGSGAEVRARSALDIALWDIAAKRAGLPLRHLVRPGSLAAIDSYNTCSGALYVNQESRQSSGNWGIDVHQRPEGEWEDLWRFLNEPGALATDLVQAGYQGMKVWPFDLAAEESGGAPDTDFRFGLSVIEEIRSAVGSTIDIYVELHSLLGVEAARRLAAELEPFDIRWIEDPIRADHTEDLKRLRDVTSAHLAVGENLGAGKNGYSQLIKNRLVDTVIFDLGWCGGITEALDIQLDIVPGTQQVAYHDCTGPVSLAVATQMSLATPHTVVQEFARSFWHTWYPEMATGVPDRVAGQLVVGDEPGHGVVLRQEFLSAPHTMVHTSTL